MRGGEDQHAGRILILNAVGAGHAVHHRHIHIQKYHLRSVLLKQRNQLLAVLRFAHQLIALHARDHLAQNQPHARLVVGNQYLYRLRIAHNILNLFQ